MTQTDDPYETLALVTALLKDRNAMNGGDLATEISLSAVAKAEAMLAKRRAARAVNDGLEGDYFRVYGWQEGRVLSAADIADVQKVLADYNDEIGEATNGYHAAREQVLREIGGDELVSAAAAADKWQSAVAVERAMEHFHRKSAEYRDKTKTAPAA
ncbi:MAG: hypothetical protein BVN33_14710 [Proteobacteria bacterium ST_bin13]|nr:MAG: hypothetical protein BVN33_14710 [Proteobacteria bacterium ST_bin13]